MNRSHNRTLKAIVKGAATTVISQKGAAPLRGDYDRLLENGTKPNLAKLTIARKIAAIHNRGLGQSAVGDRLYHERVIREAVAEDVLLQMAREHRFGRTSLLVGEDEPDARNPFRGVTIPAR